MCLFFFACALGSVQALRSALRRTRSEFQKLLDLKKVPDMSVKPQEASELEILRGVPMKNERQVQWAIEDSEGIKQPLPLWLALPIERKVTEWAGENRKWEDKIEARLCAGKSLPPASQKKYDDFIKLKTECKLLFSRKNERQVTRLRSNMDWKKMQDDLFSVVVHMSSDPEHLRIKGANGRSQRLLLWQGEPSHKGMLPDFLSQGKVSEQLAHAVLAEFEEGDEVQFSEEEGVQEAEDQDGAFQEAEAMEAWENEENEGEIMAGSSDEELLQTWGAVEGELRRVKDFNHRPEYLALEARGVTQVPPGTYLSYHKGTRNWQAIYPGEEDQHGMNFTHGGQTNRSPGEALLCAIQALVERYCAKHPKDKLWGAQLEVIRKVSHTVAKIWAVGLHAYKGMFYKRLGVSRPWGQKPKDPLYMYIYIYVVLNVNAYMCMYIAIYLLRKWARKLAGCFFRNTNQS